MKIEKHKASNHIWFGYETRCKHGIYRSIHRIDGPAFFGKDGQISYFLYNEAFFPWWTIRNSLPAMHSVLYDPVW